MVGVVGIENYPTPIKPCKQWCCSPPARTATTNTTKRGWRVYSSAMHGFDEKQLDLFRKLMFEARTALFDCQGMEYAIALLLYHFARLGNPSQNEQATLQKLVGLGVMLETPPASPLPGHSVSLSTAATNAPMDAPPAGGKPDSSKSCCFTDRAGTNWVCPQSFLD